jgi:hypothetical protein
MLEKKPFVNYTLEEDKVEGAVEVISLKINKQEREQIEQLKKLTNYGQDSKVIKLSMVIARNVILNNFGSDLFQKLTSTNRVRPITETVKPINDFGGK